MPAEGYRWSVRCVPEILPPGVDYRAGALCAASRDRWAWPEGRGSPSFLGHRRTQRRPGDSPTAQSETPHRQGCAGPGAESRHAAGASSGGVCGPVRHVRQAALWDVFCGEDRAGSSFYPQSKLDTGKKSITSHLNINFLSKNLAVNKSMALYCYVFRRKKGPCWILILFPPLPCPIKHGMENSSSFSI